jgi:hypothetical protein
MKDTNMETYFHPNFFNDMIEETKRGKVTAEMKRKEHALVCKSETVRKIKNGILIAAEEGKTREDFSHALGNLKDLKDVFKELRGQGFKVKINRFFFKDYGHFTISWG